MSDLSDMIPALKRSIAVPGGFEAVFPSVVDAELADQRRDVSTSVTTRTYFVSGAAALC